jgi:hypothetical protein
MGGIMFTAPWLLGFLLVLPIIWWLLRLIPPAPRQVSFPAIRLLQDLVTRQQTPAQTPWWLLALRLLIATLLITALAGPVLNPQAEIDAVGPLVVVIDNDWAAARDWPARQEKLQSVLQEAERANRQIYWLPTTRSSDDAPLVVTGPLSVASARALAQRLQPQPWPATWAEATQLLDGLDDKSTVVWLTSGLGGQEAEMLATKLQRFAARRIIADVRTTPLYLLTPPASDTAQPSLALYRANAVGNATIAVAAIGNNGETLSQIPVRFGPDSTRTEQELTLPLDIRNKVARFEIIGPRSAASTVLLDESWRRRPVGLAGDPAESANQSLLSPLFYIERALKPYADLQTNDLATLLQKPQSALIVTDQSLLTQQELTRLQEWVRQGGMLIRFAGPKLAATAMVAEQELLPVPLRTGDRAMGGALSWSVPQKLKPPAASSPFHGLTLPPDVTVTRQVLAEPVAELAERTWLALEDGTPLVTAKTLGLGTSVLFHIPAAADWSNLPISGLFVDLLRRLVELSGGAALAGQSEALAPYRQLDAFGTLQPPASAAEPLPADISQLSLSPRHPAGLYGTAAGAKAFNLGQALSPPAALPDNLVTESYRSAATEHNLQPWLLLLGFALLLADFFISLHLRGLTSLTKFRNKATQALKKVAVIAVCVSTTLTAAEAASAPQEAIELSGQSSLAYVITGNRFLDQVSESGLKALAVQLERRTSLRQPAVTGVELARDELSFFPLLYWPLDNSAPALSDAAVRNVSHYLQHGGMILFDTREGGNSGQVDLRRVLNGLSLPPLVTLPDNHVLKRSFYLLDDAPGRYAGGTLWIEPAQNSAFDGVATIIIGSHDWAGAWAMDRSGKPQFACIPGGETQREYAFRFGINLAIYALTGNYKEDQLHAKALLERSAP